MELPAELERLVPQWERAAWYLLLMMFHRREEPELVDLLRRRAEQSKFRQKEEVISLGQTLVEQAEARGEARGAETMLRSALQTVLTTRFGPLPQEIQVALERADVQMMDAWLRRASAAKSLEEVGIVPRQTAP